MRKPLSSLIAALVTVLLTAFAVSFEASTAQASLAPTATQCTNLIVLGARGSGETMSSGSISGFGPEVSAAAKNMISRIQRSGTYRYGSIPYAAASVGPNYWGSVNDGAALAARIVNSISNSCGNRSKFALIGYSQGAHLWRSAMPQLSAAARANVIVVGLIADPKRRGFDVNPSELGYHETFNSGTLYGSGILGAGGQFSTWLINANTKVATFCVRGDPVCNFPANNAFNWSAFSVNTHALYYQGSGAVGSIGFGLYTRLVSNGFR